MASSAGAESLGFGYYWVGSRELADKLQCNPYLLVDGDEAVLFDPGSILDVEDVYKNICALISPEKVKHVVIHHQDPDLASAIPLLEAKGMRFTVVAHWRTWSIARFYGIQSQVYLVDEHGYFLTLVSGRKLQFIQTPYLHFPGSIVTYDRQAKFLLSSDLFGAFAPAWALYAGEDYMEGMKTYHEHYMPSHEILGPVMNIFSHLEITAILPQHGSIISKDIPLYISALENLECGSFIKPLKRGGEDIGNHKSAAEKLILRFSALFGKDSTEALVTRVGIAYDFRSKLIIDAPMSGIDLWNTLGDAVYLIKGHPGLTVLEPFAKTLASEYSIAVPMIYDTLLQEAKRNTEQLGVKIAELQEINDKLAQAADMSRENLTRDMVTGLYNETYFRNFIAEEVALSVGLDETDGDVLAVIGIDEGMARIEYQYGPAEVEAIIKGIGQIIVDSSRVSCPAFRLHGTTFALWLPHSTIQMANEVCDAIRRAVENSKSFIELVRVSVGLVSTDEIKLAVADPAEAGVSLTDIGIRRLRIARKRGGNTICSSSEVGKDVDKKAKILIVDDDAVNADVIKTFLENADYAASIAKDGDEALRMITAEGYDLIISELMVPKIDGFMIKDALAQRSGTKDIPFILLSHLKDEKSVIRAYNLGVDYYLRKPFLLAELLGIVQKLTSGSKG